MTSLLCVTIVIFWFQAPQNTLSFISAVAGDNVPPECVDQPELANCELIVYARLCSNSYYSSFCCASCARHSHSKNDRFGRLGWSRGGVTNSGLGGRGDEVGGQGELFFGGLHFEKPSNAELLHLPKWVKKKHKSEQFKSASIKGLRL